MRTRDLRPGFFRNEDLARFDPLTRIFYQGLWCEADREGRVEDRPLRLRAAILPYDNCDPNKMLAELAGAGFIIRYEAKGKNIIQIANWAKHQNIHPKEVPSELPCMPVLPLDAADPKPCMAQASATDHSFPSLPSLPSSTSFINTIEQAPLARAPVFDFESVYALYPNKKGKAIGLRKCKAKIRTLEDFEAFKRGVIAYAAECRRNGTEKRFIQHFKTFVEQERWKDPPEQTPATVVARDTRAKLREIDEARKQAAPPDPASAAELERISKL